ncbi:MAG: isoprenyl transferase [bacterium]
MKKKLGEAGLKKVLEFKMNGDVPNHIAIIMDGNGRWAKKRNMPRVAGHQRGIETVREVVEACSNLGVKFLTLYTFSTENWKRPQDEVSTLMRLVVKSLKDETDELHANNIRLTTIGDLEKLPTIVRRELDEAAEKTKNNTKMVLNLALSYSGRSELTRSFKKIAFMVQSGKITADEIDEQLISDNLDTAIMPDPDLLIRTGGEQRISNFLLWQIAYTELYITDKLWPDFGHEDLLESINSFRKRERRFGLVSEQLSNIHEKNKSVKKLAKQIA